MSLANIDEIPKSTPISTGRILSLFLDTDMSLRWRSSPRPDQGSLQLIHLPRHETSLRPKSRAPKNCCCASKDTKTLRSVQVDPRGIGALSVHLEHLELGRSIPQEASSLTYSSVRVHLDDTKSPGTNLHSQIATAIDIGIAMLETQHGRRVLRRELGKLWDDVDPGSNKAYVDNFLERMRHDFPWVAVERMSPNVIVAARRLDRLTRGREDSPKRFGIYFNYYGVAAMVQACSQAPKSRAMKLRFHTYLFKFACAIAHEVCTLLMCQSPDSPAGPWTVPGILPGARFDDLLFGGCLKFYGNQGMDASHVGPCDANVGELY